MRKILIVVDIQEGFINEETERVYKRISEILKKEKLPNKIFICGVDTECCVLKTAVDFFENGIRPFVLANYCFSTAGKKFHDAGILCLTRLIGESNIIYNEIEDI